MRILFRVFVLFAFVGFMGCSGPAENKGDKIDPTIKPSAPPGPPPLPKGPPKDGPKV